MKQAFFLAIVTLSVRWCSVRAENACSAKADVFHWERLGGFFEFREVMRVCSLQFLAEAGQEDFVPDFITCIKNQGLPYRTDCRTCIAELAQCTIEKCINGCFFGDENPQCEACADQECNPTYLECAGPKMDPKQCSRCVKPLGKLIFFLPDFVTIVLGLLLATCFVVVVYRFFGSGPNDSDDDYLDDEKIIEQKALTAKSYHKTDLSGTRSGYRKDSSSNSRDPPQKLSFTDYSGPPRNGGDAMTLLTSKGLGNQLQELDFDQATEVPQFFTSNRTRAVDELPERNPFPTVANNLDLIDGNDSVGTPPPPAGFTPVAFDEDLPSV